MRHLDLFSGIGGFALAASRVWPNHEVISFCDIEPFAQKVLKKHWPDVPCHDDIKTMKGSDYANIDLLTGGFPCQPFSTAGQRRGSEDDRHLWPEMLRVIREAKPRWIVGENVRGLTNWNDGLVFQEVLSDLEAEGYSTQSFLIPACAVDAPHRRDRVWIVAYTKERRLQGGIKAKRMHQKEDGEQSSESTRSGARGRQNVADTEHRNGEKSKLRPRIASETSGETSDRYSDGCPTGSGGWLPEPNVGRVANGIPNRVDRLKGLGNAIVPQVAEMIFRAIRESE